MISSTFGFTFIFNPKASDMAWVWTTWLGCSDTKISNY